MESSLWKLKIKLEDKNHLSIKNLKTLKVARKYSFYADPFFSKGPSLLQFEALNKSTGLGEIVEVMLKMSQR